MTGFKIEYQRGEPWRVGEREIVPEARVWSFHLAQMGLNEQGASGGGLHWSWSHPTAMIERVNGAERRIPVHDVNRQLEAALVIAAIVLPLLLITFTRWARHSL